MIDVKLTDQMTRRENDETAAHEIAGHEITGHKREGCETGSH